MNTLVKISIGASLALLAACSGKGNADSRINSVDLDDNNLPNQNTESQNSSTTAACMSAEVGVCVQVNTTDASVVNECTAERGQLMDKCPSEGTSCGTENAETEDGVEFTATIYAYGSTTCSDIADFLAESNF